MEWKDCEVEYIIQLNESLKELMSVFSQFANDRNNVE